jgi:hypothetical protein
VEQALFPEPTGLDIAIVVEDRERLPLLEHPGPLIG